MKALHIREAFRLLEEARTDDRDIVWLLELGSEGCSFAIGPQYHGGPRERWVITNDGMSRKLEGVGT